MNAILSYIMGSTSIIVIVLLYIAYLSFRTKRMIQKQIQYENQNRVH